MTSDEKESTCPKCSAVFYYDAKYHRCPGEWEAVAGAPPANPYEGMSWVEEQMSKQY